MSRKTYKQYPPSEERKQALLKYAKEVYGNKRCYKVKANVQVLTDQGMVEITPQDKLFPDKPKSKILVCPDRNLTGVLLHPALRVRRRSFERLVPYTQPQKSKFFRETNKQTPAN